MRFCVVAAVVSLLMACPGPVPAGDGGVDAGPLDGPDGGLNVNDVSFLYPLPAVGAEGQLLALSTAGDKGALLPRALHDGLPVIDETQTRDTLYDTTRIISVRVDPCFPGSTPPAAPVCIKQIRLVAQPLTPDENALLTQSTRDATIHLFYALTDAEFSQVHATLFELKQLAGRATDGVALDVHPVMKAQGLEGPYAQKLNAMLRKFCGAQNLTRVAFMSVAQGGRNWKFGAFNVENGALVDSLIPRMPDLKIQGFQETGSNVFREGTLLPAAPGDAIDVLLSEQQMRLTDEYTLRKALASALKIENPGLSSPKTIDCASCHVASRSRHNAERHWAYDTSGFAERYSAPRRQNVTRVDQVGDNAQALRAFGYFGRQTAFSLRTINESAEIAEALSTRP